MMSTERCKRQRRTETGKGFLKAAAAAGPSTEHPPSRSSNPFDELENQAQGLRSLQAALGVRGDIRAVGKREAKAEK